MKAGTASGSGRFVVALMMRQLTLRMSVNLPKKQTHFWESVGTECVLLDCNKNEPIIHVMNGKRIPEHICLFRRRNWGQAIELLEKQCMGVQYFLIIQQSGVHFWGFLWFLQLKSLFRSCISCICQVFVLKGLLQDFCCVLMQCCPIY